MFSNLFILEVLKKILITYKFKLQIRNLIQQERNGIFPKADQMMITAIMNPVQMNSITFKIDLKT